MNPGDPVEARWDETWPLADGTRCWRVVSDVLDPTSLFEQAGWDERLGADLVRVEVWFVREGLILDEWGQAFLRSEIGRACEFEEGEWIAGDYAQEVADEQSRLLRMDEAEDVWMRIADLPCLNRPRMEHHPRLHWSDGLNSDLPVRPWPDVFGRRPGADIGVRVITISG